MISKNTGVAPRSTTINLTGEDNDDDDTVHTKYVKDVEDDGDQEYDPHANIVQEPVPSE